MLEEELNKIIKSMEDAFDIPEYFGELSKAKLKDASANKILERSIEHLETLSKKYPSSPEVAFLSGILSRYLGNEPRFQKQISLSHELNPDYLEAQIAKIEGEKYLDPFCYLSIKDLQMNPNGIRPISRIFLKVEGAYIDLVRDGIHVIPVFIMRFEKTGGRPFPHPDMPTGLAMEICSVLPDSPGIPNGWKWPVGNSENLKRHMKPFLDVLAGKKDFTTILAVCPMLVNDHNAPFFKTICVNPSPLKMLKYDHDYQPFKGRYEGLRLCHPPYRTIFVFVDEQNACLLVREVDLNYMKPELLKMREVIKHLPTTPITLSEWKRAKEAYEKHCFYGVTASDGHTYSIPKHRTGRERLNIIFGLEFRDGEVRAERGSGQPKDRQLTYDIFVSHSHDDQKIAYAITEWMDKTWPNIKLFMTSRDQCEIDEILPGYYALGLHASRILLFIATPNSLKSSHTLIELGSASQLGIKVIGVCAEGTTVADLVADGLRGYFDTVVDITHKEAESLLTECISSALNLPIAQDSQVGVLATLLMTPRYISDPELSISTREKYASIANKLGKNEMLSKEEALIWLDVLEKNVLNKARMAGIDVERLPRSQDVSARLAEVLISSDENKYDELLQMFVPLLDDDFIQYLQLLYNTFLNANEEKIAETVLKLLQVCKRLIAKE